MIWLMVIARNITMGIAWHRFTAWFNIYFKRESDGSTALGAMKPLTSEGKAVTLDDIDDLDEDSVLGVGKVEDFSWKGILDFTTCTECGRCQSQCPAWNTEKPLSPKLLITALRDHAYAKADGDPGPRRRATLIGVGSKGESGGTAGTDVLDYFYNPERRRLRHRRGRAVELHVVRRLRPAVPRRHRARRPHHGHAALPGAGGVQLPRRAQPALQGPGEQGQPVEHVDAPRGWTGPRASTSRSRSSARTWSPSSRSTGCSGSAAPGRTRTARRRPPAPSPSCSTWPASPSACSATARPAPATRPVAPATSSSSRAWPSRTSRPSRSTRSRRSSRPAPTASTRSRTSTRTSASSSRSCTTPSCSTASCARAS